MRGAALLLALCALAATQAAILVEGPADMDVDISSGAMSNSFANLIDVIDNALR